MERVPCNPEKKDSDRCALYRRIGKCFMDLHHEYHPRADYKSPIEKEFRELSENKTHTCRDTHNERHATEPVPDKPDIDFMREAVNRARIIKLLNEKETTHVESIRNQGSAENMEVRRGTHEGRTRTVGKSRRVLGGS